MLSTNHESCSLVDLTVIFADNPNRPPVARPAVTGYCVGPKFHNLLKYSYKNAMRMSSMLWCLTKYMLTGNAL